MPSFTGKTFASFYKNILALKNPSFTGVTTTALPIQDGEGNKTAMSISDDEVLIRPQNDDLATTVQIKNTSGGVILKVNTVDSLVTVGATQAVANTQYAYFGISYAEAMASNMLDDTHYAIPFSMGNYGAIPANYAMGTATTSSFNDTEPATSLTISSTAQSIVRSFWYVMDNITIDRVIWWQGADAAAGSSTAAYLMSYTVDTTTGSTGGDLSSGVKQASSSTVTNAGYEQAYYNQMSIHSADVDAGRVILFTFCFDDTEATDYSLNATVKYHIR